MPIVTLQPDESMVKDCYVSEYSTATNYNNDKIIAGDANPISSYDAYIGHLHFMDLDNILPNSAMNSIKIQLYCEFVNADLLLYKITGDWNETTVTYTTRPAREATQFLRFRPVVGWNEIDVTKIYNSGNCKGIAFNTLSGDSFSIRFYSSSHANTTLRPKLYLEYIQRPTIGFHDENTLYYSDNRGDIIKLLDFGTLIAGQTSAVKQVFLKNLTGESIKNVQISVDQPSVPNHSTVELSKTNNPFIPEPTLFLNGLYTDGQSASFYVRVVSTEQSLSGFQFNIKAKSDFV